MQRECKIGSSYADREVTCERVVARPPVTLLAVEYCDALMPHSRDVDCSCRKCQVSVLLLLLYRDVTNPRT